jgi:hypothetical protein
MEKKILEGLSPGQGKNVYARPSTKNDLLTVKEWKPSSGVDLNKDPVIKFHLKTGPDEFIR